MSHQRASERASTYPAGERLVTLVADKCSGDKVGVVVALEVHVQQLFLPERLLALAAGKWLLPGVRALVHDHMALLRPQKKRAVDFTAHVNAATVAHVHGFAPIRTCLQQ